MPKVASKLFRAPDEVKAVIGELKAKGFKKEEIAILAGGKKAKDLDAEVKQLSETGELTAMGVPEATVNYYQYAVESGGIVVSVQADEGRIAQAQELLRAAPVSACEEASLQATSPGFLNASRMSATNPIDAPMSGDFRRY
jgi:hypothetical protein